MRTLSAQVDKLIDEIERRDFVESSLTETQSKLSACLTEKKMFQGSFKASLDEVTAEIGSLRAENRKLQGELARYH